MGQRTGKCPRLGVLRVGQVGTAAGERERMYRPRNMLQTALRRPKLAPLVPYPGLTIGGRELRKSEVIEMPRFIPIVLLSIGIAVPVSAQSRDRGPDNVPPGHRPPPGMCRIWIDGVPPGQQPEPTDCATAVRERPAGARVIFGDRRSDGDDRAKGSDKRGGKKAKVAKGFADEDRRDRRDDDRCATIQSGEDCDEIVRRPGTWPQMAAAIALARGSRTDDVRRWLGSAAATVRYEDRDRNGRPEHASWYDRAGQLVQEWVDADRDGIADTIRLYRDGKLMRVYEK